MDTCEQCKSVHNCTRCVKNMHICLICGKIVHKCLICGITVCSLSQFMTHQKESKMCKNVRFISTINFLEEQLSKAGIKVKPKSRRSLSNIY